MIHVVSPGLETTVKDLGRYGFARLGISPAGAADILALRVGNRLVGNPDGAPAFEMTLLGGTFRFDSEAVVALTGSDFGATLDGQPVPMWQAFEVAPGQTLACGATRSGARCYLCATSEVTTPRRVRPEWLARWMPRKELRVTGGPQENDFDARARITFYAASFRVREESNRAGLRLEGPHIEPPFGGEMLTEGVSLGAIQVPPGGQPIILFVDQQTTGGYPMVANVISADLPSVGQLRPRDEIRFLRVPMEEARRLLLELEASIEREAFEPL